jgi:hypothetical protein
MVDSIALRRGSEYNTGTRLQAKSALRYREQFDAGYTNDLHSNASLALSRAVLSSPRYPQMTRNEYVELVAETRV